MDVPLWLALVVVGCLVVSHVGQRRHLEDHLDTLADALDDAQEQLRLAAVDPLTGRTFVPRDKTRRGWTPRPQRRTEALRALYGLTGRERGK